MVSLVTPRVEVRVQVTYNSTARLFHYSSIVGFAVMVALISVPARIAKYIRKVQKEKMKAVGLSVSCMYMIQLNIPRQSDTRVQSVTESE